MPVARAEVRDVCFAHWPVEADDLDAVLPAGLAPATLAETAWTSVLAQRTLAGVRGLPLTYEFPQVALRTYVVPADRDAATPADGDLESVDGPGHSDAVGVYFLRVEADSRLAAVGGRLLYDVPYHHTSIRHRRRDGAVDVRSVDADGRETLTAEFRPASTPSDEDPESRIEWLTDRYRYYRADGRSGRTDHPPWPLYEAEATLRADGLFDRVDLPTPEGEPLVRYSPGVEFTLSERA